uniref:Ig-like domain-containing protein n=1 Tax=Romanomermis culicivorax TaxID=13658 RepID=A0A915LCS7_ROMCU
MLLEEYKQIVCLEKVREQMPTDIQIQCKVRESVNMCHTLASAQCNVTFENLDLEMTTMVKCFITPEEFVVRTIAPRTLEEVTIHFSMVNFISGFTTISHFAHTKTIFVQSMQSLFQKSIREREEASIFTSLSITEQPLQAPIFVQPLKDQVATEGEKIKFKAIVAGFPLPEVKWTVDGDQIVPSELHSFNDECDDSIKVELSLSQVPLARDFKIIYEDGVTILVIKEAFLEDEGEYSCTAYNSSGSTTTSAFLKIQSKILWAA